jgi:hypothetical protein
MPLSKDLREFVECLNSNDVEYLVVGALARVLCAIRQFGFGSLDIKPEDLTATARVIQLGQAPNRIDLMTAISGVPVDEAWSTRIEGASGHGKDRIDAEELRKLDPPR